MLIHQGWNIRKTQLIINRIRENIIPQDIKNIVFENYGAKKLELPDFYTINIIFSEILKISIMFITIVVGNTSICCWLAAIAFITILSIMIDIGVYQFLKPKE